ncbi:MAG: PIN domain-containing protein [Rectinemataceae bacterium]|nr:PIN domain-containing protein [Rectinemataceae bacterium]
MRVFIDACCFFAAFKSPNGGSALILELARLGRLSAVASVRVIQESCRNIKNKIDQETVVRFHRAIRAGLIEIVPTPEGAAITQWETLTHAKDCHVLAGATMAKVDCLVTLDRKHLLTVKVKGNFPIPVKTPTDFLDAFLPGS